MKRRFKIYNEDTLQIAIVAWCRSRDIDIYHVRNGVKLPPREAGRQKSQGILNGVPDLQLDIPRCGYHGLRMELKYNDGQLSSDQVKRIKILLREGYRVTVQRHYNDAIKEIEKYVDNRLTFRVGESIISPSATD